MLLGNSSVRQFLQQLSAVHALHAAVRMSDNHNLFHAKFNDGNQKTADHTSVWMRDHAAGVFNDLRITVFQAECRREQLDQPSIHTGQDCKFLVRILTGQIRLIRFILHKFFIVLHNFINHCYPPHLNNDT